MADVLLELGRAPSMGAIDTTGIESLVSLWENPAAGVDIEIDPAMAKILAKMREVSAKARAGLVSESLKLAGCDPCEWESLKRRPWEGRESTFEPPGAWSGRSLNPDKDWDAQPPIRTPFTTGSDTPRFALVRYDGIHGKLRRMIGEFRLEKSIFSKLADKAKSMASKVSSTLSNPAMLGLIGGAASLIPGAGAVVGPALSLGANFIAGKTGQDPAALRMQMLGMSQAVAGLTGSTAANANALALAKAFGIPPAAPGAPPIDTMSFIGTLLKGAGQLVNVNALSKGSGADSPFGGALDSVFAKLGISKELGPAVAAGKQDVLNTAAAFGMEQSAETAINRGTPSEVPWVPIGIGAGTLLLLTTMIVASRR